MSPSKQVNVRVPETAQDLLLRIGRLLRDDSSFPGKLERFLNEYADPSYGPQLTERVERLERQMDSITRRRAVSAQGTPQDTPSITPNQNLFGEREGPNPAWSIGEGKGKRLSLEGEREIERLIHAGQDNNAIAKAMGIKPFAVQNRREKILGFPDLEG